MITIEQRRIIDAMKGGARLCVQIEDGERVYFFSDSTIKSPRRPSVDILLKSGIVAQSDDGMFGDCQTYDLMFDPGNS